MLRAAPVKRTYFRFAYNLSAFFGEVGGLTTMVFGLAGIIAFFFIRRLFVAQIIQDCYLV